MKIYLLDDDTNVIRILRQIIQDRGLGEICGACTSAEDTLDDIQRIRPDVAIVDLLMPGIDGISLVRTAREHWKDTTFIMLSQVSSKDMIAESYDSGVSFYIQKPINSVEVEHVLRNVARSLEYRDTYRKMKKLFSDMEQQVTAAPETDAAPSGKDPACRDRASVILRSLGILGKTGSQDILNILEFMIEEPETAAGMTLLEVFAHCSDDPAKSVAQRVRRAITAGLTNLAHIGLSDYNNEVFLEYAGTLYPYEMVRREMNRIQGSRVEDDRNNIRIRNFLNNLLSFVTVN